MVCGMMWCGCYSCGGGRGRAGVEFGGEVRSVEEAEPKSESEPEPEAS